MISFKYVTKDYESAVELSSHLNAEKVKNSVFKPLLLYLREIHGDDVTDPYFGINESVDAIRENSNMYFQLTREDSKNVSYYENGIICEPDSDYPDSVVIFLLNGTIYLIDSNYKQSILEAKKFLGKPLVWYEEDSFVSTIKNKVVNERQTALIEGMIKNVDIALGLEKAPGTVKFEVVAVNPRLDRYSNEEMKTGGKTR